MSAATPAVGALAALLCSTTERRAERGEELRALARQVSEPELATFLVPHRLGPLGLKRFSELAGASCDRSLERQLDDVLPQLRVWAVLQEDATDRVTTALAEAGIRSVPLKGPLLGAALYGDPAMRSSSDVDVLVEPDRLEEAVEVVIRRTRYRRVDNGHRERGRPRLHHVLFDERDVMPPLELHWRIHWYEQRFSRELLDSADGGPRPDAEHELAALLLFYARDGFLGLRFACDLAAWWDARGSELGPEALRPLVARHPALGRPLDAAARMAERIVGFPSARVLDTTQAPERRIDIALRLGNWRLTGPPEEQSTSVVLIDGLLAPPAGLLRFVGRALDPRRPQTGQKTRLARTTAMITHPFKVIGRSLMLLLWRAPVSPPNYPRSAA